MGEHQVQLYVLCAVDDEGYMNVLEVADGHLHVGTPLRIMWRSWWISCRLPVPPLRGGDRVGGAARWSG